MLAALLHGDLEHHRLHLRLRRGERYSGWASLRLSNVRDTTGVVRHVLVELIDISAIVAKSAYLQAAVEAGVVVTIEGGPVLRWWQGFYEWAHGRYHMLEDGYDSWIGHDID